MRCTRDAKRYNRSLKWRVKNEDKKSTRGRQILGLNDNDPVPTPSFVLFVRLSSTVPHVMPCLPSYPYTLVSREKEREN